MEDLSAAKFPFEPTSGDRTTLSAELHRLAEENQDLRARIARSEEAVRTLRRAFYVAVGVLQDSGTFPDEPATGVLGTARMTPSQEVGLLLEKVRMLLPEED